MHAAFNINLHSMIHASMDVSQSHQPIISCKFVRINSGFLLDFSVDNFLKFHSCHFCQKLKIDTAISFKDPKHRLFSKSCSSSFFSQSQSAIFPSSFLPEVFECSSEKTLIHLHGSGDFLSVISTFLNKDPANKLIALPTSFGTFPQKFSCLVRAVTKNKIPHQFIPKSQGQSVPIKKSTGSQ